LKEGEIMWTKETLAETLHSKMADFKLIVVSNRQPYRHIAKGSKIIAQREPGGLVTALDPVMHAAKGTWIAAGAGDADRRAADASGKVMLPPNNPSYALRRIFLSKEDRDAYYYGYSNEGLWPLSHIAYTRPVFMDSDWQAYQKVNRLFAEALLEEIGNQKAFVWVQDFHLVLVGKYLREANRPDRKSVV
jgi:trehalose 6-phosphate synthase